MELNQKLDRQIALTMFHIIHAAFSHSAHVQRDKERKWIPGHLHSRLMPYLIQAARPEVNSYWTAEIEWWVSHGSEGWDILHLSFHSESERRGLQESYECKTEIGLKRVIETVTSLTSYSAGEMAFWRKKSRIWKWDVNLKEIKFAHLIVQKWMWFNEFLENRNWQLPHPSTK